MNKRMIWAEDLNGIIGNGLVIPWQGQLPADLRYFQLVTMGNPVLMGRKTYISLPPHLAPLKGRENGILSLDPNYNPRLHSTREDYNPDEVFCFNSLDAALDLFESRDAATVWLMGGGQLYAEALARQDFDAIYRTVVEAEFEGDIKAPSIDPAIWKIKTSWHHEPYDDLFKKQNEYPFRWEVYERAVA